MADPITAQAATDSAQAAQTTTSQDSATGSATAAAQEAETERFDAEYVRKLRAEAADHRKRLREFEAAQKAADDAKLSETERLTKQIAEFEAQQKSWEAERRETRAQRAVDQASQKLGIVDAEAARLLLGARLTFDADGQPEGVEKHLTELLKAKPYLAGQAQHASSGAATNPGSGQRGTGSGGTFTRKQYGDRAFYLANKPALDRALAEGRIVQG